MSKARNLIIDGQILQTGALHRGMGKYVLNMLREIDELLDEATKLHIIFNSKLNMEEGQADLIHYLCPKTTIHILDMPVPTRKGDREAKYTEKLDGFIQNEFSNATNYFLITSLFMFDYFAAFPNNARKLLLFYDLTPFMFWKDLGGYFPPDIYMARFTKILEAEQIFAISETTKQDLIRTFGLLDENVVNINGGFVKVSDNPSKPKAFDIPKHYILFPTGDLPHKNNERAVKALALFNETSDDKYTLLITSTFSEKSQAKLNKLSEDIIFTGNVSDEELEWLYENADMVLFTSKYEGLGMPILDAVANQKPIAASNIPVFKEMTKNAYYFFNPDDVNEIANAIRESTSNKIGFKLNDYPKIMKKYTWKNTATDLISAIMNSKSTSKDNTIVAREKIAIVCVHPGINDQLGRRAEPLHNYLSKHWEIDYYFDPLGRSPAQIERPTYLNYIGPRVQDISELSPWEYRKYKHVVYFVDDLTPESWISEIASVLPGIVLKGKMSDLNEEKLRTVFENNHVIETIPNSYGDLYALLNERLNTAGDTRAKLIIKKTWLNRSIIKRLLREESQSV